MELTMTNGFTALSLNEMEMVDGGGWGQFFKALGGGLAIAASPIALACGGPLAAAGLLGGGLCMIGDI